MNLILVHGILGFRQKLGLEYFNGVAERYSGVARVFAAELDPTASVQTRGGQLCGQINDAFARGTLAANDRTHIIAHSMGGLDARFVLSPASGQQLRSPVHTLTTISTPHRGSGIADLVHDVPGFQPGTQLANTLSHAHVSVEGLRDLTTAACAAFNASFPDNPAVRYFSEAGSGRRGILIPTSILFLTTHTLLDKPNDGLVTVESTKWGTFNPDTWPCDHADEVGHDLDRPPLFEATFDHFSRYDRILQRVQ